MIVPSAHMARRGEVQMDLAEGFNINIESRPAHQAFIPSALSKRLQDLADWLAALERILASGAGALKDRPQQLNELFVKLWEAAGMDASPGLARSKPDHRLFRKMVGAYFWQSPQMRRGFEKPRGYAGDFLMMDAICNRPPPAETLLGDWLDGWFQETFPGARSVRNRRDLVARLLASESTRGARRVLNVASGGAPELAHIPLDLAFDQVVLLDQDSGALAFAQQSLARRDALRTAPLPVQTLCMPIRTLVRTEGALGTKPYDVIYSMGLYDYLLRDTATALTSTLWDALAPGGILVIGNYQGHHWARYVVEAVMDWFLVYRDEDDLRELAADLPDAGSNIVTDATGLVHLLHLRKQ